jgi:hypothetical protein
MGATKLVDGTRLGGAPTSLARQRQFNDPAGGGSVAEGPGCHRLTTKEITVENPSKPAGRPPIYDHLEVYYFVETQRLARGVSVRGLTSDYRVRFVSRFPNSDGTTRELAGETLRGRYKEALEKVGIISIPRWIKFPEPEGPGPDGEVQYSGNPLVNETLKTLDTLYRDWDA